MDAAAVEGNAGLIFERGQIRGQLLVVALLPDMLLEHLRLRVEDRDTPGSIDQRDRAFARRAHRLLQAHHGGDPAGPRHDRRVRRATAQIRGEAEDLVPRRERHLAGGNVGGDDQGGNAEIAQRVGAHSAQVGQNAAPDVANVERPVAVIFAVGLVQSRRDGAEDPPIAPRRRPALLLDRGDRLVERIRIFEDRDLGIEEAGVLLTGLERDLRAQIADLFLARAKRRLQPLLLRGDLIRGDLAVLDLDLLVIDDVDRPHADSRGRRDSRQNGHSSPNLSFTTLTSAAIACCSSEPSALSESSAPRSAASIITPRMLFPFTSRPSRARVMWLAYLAASFTKTEQARAWRPSRFWMTMVVSIMAIGRS